MPGNSPGEAVDNFLRPIKAAIECLGSGHLHYRDHPPLDTVQTATLNAGEGIRVPAAGAHAPTLRVTIELHFIPVYCPEDEIRGPYRCRSASYILALYDANDREMVSFHWHPIQTASPFLKPHMHVGEASMPQLERLHVPTPRITVEEFLAMAIESFGAQPRIVGWPDRLRQSRERHEQYRSWADGAEAPTFPEHRPDSN